MTKKRKGYVSIPKKVAEKLHSYQFIINRKNGIVSFGCGSVKWSKKDLLILLKALPILKKMHMKKKKNYRMPYIIDIISLTPSELKGIIG